MCSLSTHRLMDGLVSSKKCRTVILGLLLRFPLKCCMQDEHMERSPLTEEHHQAHQGSELSLCQHASFQHDCQRRWCGPHLHPVSQPDERCSLLLHQHRGGQHASYAPNCPIMAKSWQSRGKGSAACESHPPWLARLHHHHWPSCRLCVWQPLSQTTPCNDCVIKMGAAAIQTPLVPSFLRGGNLKRVHLMDLFIFLHLHPTCNDHI